MRYESILKKLKIELGQFRKFVTYWIYSSDLIHRSVFSYKEKWLEEPINRALNLFFKQQKNIFNVIKISNVDLALQYKKAKLLIEVKPERESFFKFGKNVSRCYSFYCRRSGRSLSSGNSGNLKGLIYYKNSNNNEILTTYIINSDDKICNVSGVGVSQIAAYAMENGYRQKEKNIIPLVFYLKENELWHITKIENLSSSYENLPEECRRNNRNVSGLFKVIAHKFKG